MKKLLLIFIALSLILSAGCGSVYTYKFLDAETHKPLSGAITINGKTFTLENGVLKTNKTHFTAEKAGYIKKEVSNSNTLVKLTPIAFLKIQFIQTNGSSVSLPLEDTQILLNGAALSKNTVSVTENGTILISPIKLGNNTIAIKNTFTNEVQTVLNAKKGENDVTISISYGKDKVAKFLDTLLFPKNLQECNAQIAISGTIDEDSVHYNLNAKFIKGTATEIWDKNIHYKFENNTPYIVENGNEIAVKDAEQIAALKFARSVVKKALMMAGNITDLNIISFSRNKGVFSGERTFENRHYQEKVTIVMDKNMIKEEKIHIRSSEIENTDLTIDITVK